MAGVGAGGAPPACVSRFRASFTAMSYRSGHSRVRELWPLSGSHSPRVRCSGLLWLPQNCPSPLQGFRHCASKDTQRCWRQTRATHLPATHGAGSRSQAGRVPSSLTWGSSRATFTSTSPAFTVFPLRRSSSSFRSRSCCNRSRSLLAAPRVRGPGPSGAGLLGPPPSSRPAPPPAPPSPSPPAPPSPGPCAPEPDPDAGPPFAPLPEEDPPPPPPPPPEESSPPAPPPTTSSPHPASRSHSRHVRSNQMRTNSCEYFCATLATPRASFASLKSGSPRRSANASGQTPP